MGRVRSGLAEAGLRLAPSWVGATASVPAAWSLAAAVLAASAAGALATIGLARPFARGLSLLPARALTTLALAFLALTALVLTGPTGLLLFVASTSLGVLPIVAGWPRLPIIGCLVLPILARLVQ